MTSPRPWLPALPILAALLACPLPARANWLGLQPGIEPAAQADAYSFLQQALAGETDDDDAEDAAWLVAHLSRQKGAVSIPMLDDTAAATPPLAEGAPADPPRRSVEPPHLPALPEPVWPAPPLAPANPVPGAAAAVAPAAPASPDPIWLAAPGALLALLGWRQRARRKPVPRPRRPWTLHGAR